MQKNENLYNRLKWCLSTWANQIIKYFTSAFLGPIYNWSL